MTGFINYLDVPLDPRLKILLDRWEALRRGDALPAYNDESAAIFAEAREHLALIEIRPAAQKFRPRAGADRTRLIGAPTRAAN
jgi:hypothetical protein